MKKPLKEFRDKFLLMTQQTIKKQNQVRKIINKTLSKKSEVVRIKHFKSK